MQFYILHNFSPLFIISLLLWICAYYPSALFFCVVISFWSARCIRWKFFSVFRHWVIVVTLLDCVYAVRCSFGLKSLFVRWTSCSLLLTEYDMHLAAAVAAHTLKFEVSRCRTSQFGRAFFCRPKFDWPFFCRGFFTVLPYTCLALKCWTGLREQLTVRCFPEWCLFLFSLAHVLVWLRMQFVNNFFFLSWVSVAGFNENNNNLACIGYNLVNVESAKYV